MGLSIAKGILEAHGGRIWIESQLGQGATFIFTLPRAQVTKRTPSGLASSKENGTAHVEIDATGKIIVDTSRLYINDPNAGVNQFNDAGAFVSA
jgi:hypothetical protein